MDKKDDGLLPCPFCGSPATFEFKDYNPADRRSGDDGMGWVQCSNYKCGAMIFDDRMSAIEKWNTRYYLFRPEDGRGQFV
ncbi:MAG: Lar family restriction alleviation protein [Thermodesulfobacteriota bacterium]|nr:Lar family restriction alleviation protein [Thermodesulfobacteriota bacterium]